MRTRLPRNLLALQVSLLSMFIGICQAQVRTARRLPAVDELVRRHIQQTGGETKWNAIQTQMRKGFALPDLGNLPLATFAKAPGQWEFELSVPGARVVRRGFDGQHGWEQDKSPRLLDSEQAFDETIIYDPFWPLHFHRYFPKASVEATPHSGAGGVWVVEAFTPTGNKRTLNFDAASGLLTRVGNVVFDDYRIADGVKVPFRVRFGWQTLRFSEIHHNVPVDDARFALPAPLEAAADLLPSRDQILDRYLAAVGGPAALEVRSEVRKGTLYDGNRSFPIETFARTPDRWLLVVALEPGRVERQGYDGASAWKERAGFLEAIDPDDRRQLASFLDLQLPRKLREGRKTMKVIGQESRGTRTVYAAEARLAGLTESGSGPPAVPASGQAGADWFTRLLFDAQTGLLVEIGSVALEDYRDIDGVKVPFLVRSERSGTEIRFTEISRRPVDEALFKRPPPSAAFEMSFAGLTDAPAIAVLREAFGQGSTPADGRLLYDLIREKGYRKALEVGAASGYCSAWLALALRQNGGRLTTIEIDPDAADLARENLHRAALFGVVDLRVNDALLEIPRLSGPFDFVFLDPGAPLNKKLLDLVYAKIVPGGALVAHDAESFPAEQPDFLKAIQSDPHLETRFLSTPTGTMSLSIKKQ
jgi:predicted O-methyltransferase YrrM